MTILAFDVALRRFAIDAPVARIAGGFGATPVIAGSHVAGKLRQAWEELSDYDPAFKDALQWLGAEGLTPPAASAPAKAEFAGRRRRLSFGDFEADGGGDPLGRRNRIAICETTGAASDGALLTMETPWPAGAEVTFRGTLRFSGAGDGEALIRQVRLGLNWMVQLGAERSVGFGRVLGAEVGVREHRPAAAAPSTDADGRIGFLLEFHDPFCIAEQTTQSIWKNTFRACDYVPGAVTRGVLANMLAAAGPDKFPCLESHFDKLRATHAFAAEPPAAGDAVRRPVAVPLSLSVDGDKAFADAALSEPCSLLKDEAPAFAPNWKVKTWDEAGKLCGASFPQTELRLHTAIDAEKLRADEGNLFAQEVVRPEGFVWAGHLDLSGLAPGRREEALAEIRRLAAGGVGGIGKTDAWASLHLVAATRVSPAVPSVAAGQGVFVVTLQSHALLCGPEPFAVGAKDAPALLEKEYAAAWTEATDGLAEMQAHFAGHSLWGGRFLASRYFDGTGDRYRPYVLTGPGSVFVLRAVAGKEKQAERKLAHLARHGLPLPTIAKRGYMAEADWSVESSGLWRCCPFVPENGYGEIAVDLSLHRTLRRDADWRPDRTNKGGPA